MRMKLPARFVGVVTLGLSVLVVVWVGRVSASPLPMPSAALMQAGLTDLMQRHLGVLIAWASLCSVATFWLGIRLVLDRKQLARALDTSFAGFDTVRREGSGDSDLINQVCMHINELTLNHKATQSSNLRATLRLRRMLETVPVSILAYDRDGRVCLANRSARQLLGLAEWPIHKPRFEDLFAEPERVSVSRLVRKFQETGTHSLMGNEYRRAMRSISGERVSVRVYESLLCGTRTSRSVLLIHDLTSADHTESALHLAVEEARSASDMKSRFLAMISHEIRTPLNGITGLVDLLSRETPAPHQVEYLALLSNSTQHLRNLLTDILDFSKIEAGQMHLDAVPFDIHELVEATSQSVKASADAKRLTLQSKINALDTLVIGDPVRVRQIITNLLDNAIKFTPAGGVTLSCEASICSTDNAWVDVRIAIADTGIGIAGETLKRLFTPFTQGSQSITRNFGGTGLGLSLCAQLARKMMGDVVAQSTLGAGSVFTISIRLGRGPRKSAAPLLPPGNAGATFAAFPEGTRMLVVDDNQLNQRILKRWLELRGAHIDLAADGAEAVQYAIRGKYHIVLMDFSMPTMDGLTATTLIRENERKNDLAATPIVGVTALSTATDHSVGLAAGMNTCIAKPVDRMALMQVIDRLLRANTLSTSPNKPTQ